MKAIIFDAFGTLFKVAGGGSAQTVMNHIAACGVAVDERAFREEWMAFYKAHTSDGSKFMTERDIFITRIQMFYNRYGISRSAENDADALQKEAFKREAYPETKRVLHERMKHHRVFIGSNTDNDALGSVMRRNYIAVHKIYTSEDLKCYKPDPCFYRAILNDIGLSPKDVLFVGDSLTDDVQGPRTVGMRSAWLDRTNSGEAYVQADRITSLTSLLEIL